MIINTKITYHKFMRIIKESLWYAWHCKLRKLFSKNRNDYFREDSRPFWHFCCNGNAGGWRTWVCDSLEDGKTGYRYHDACLLKLEGQKK